MNDETPTTSMHPRRLVFEVRKDEIATARVREEPLPVPREDEVLCAVERFSLTSNNVTYAVTGERLGYWRMFPSQDGWGQIPVWAHLRVVAGSHEGLPVGARAYGLCPPASHVVLRPSPVGPAGFLDTAPHRAELGTAYRSYAMLDSGEARDREREERLLVLAPLFWLSFMLVDALGQRDALSGRRIVVTSASSKAAIGTAHLLQSRAVETVGLTSRANIGFVRALGVYDEVLEYTAAGELSSAPSVLLDIAGDGALRETLQSRLGPAGLITVIAGGTHHETAAEPLAASTDFLFVPERMRERARELGWPELNRRYQRTLDAFAEDSAAWLKIHRGTGPDAVMAAYLQTLRNANPPQAAHVLALS